MLVSFQTELPEDAVDTALVPTRTLEACGVDMSIRCGGQEESYPGCSLNPSAPDYLIVIAHRQPGAALDDLIGRGLEHAPLDVGAGVDAAHGAGGRQEGGTLQQRIIDLDPGGVEGGVPP